jgi:hypothetical protein
MRRESARVMKIWDERFICRLRSSNLRMSRQSRPRGALSLPQSDPTPAGRRSLSSPPRPFPFFPYRRIRNKEEASGQRTLLKELNALLPLRVLCSLTLLRSQSTSLRFSFPLPFHLSTPCLPALALFSSRSTVRPNTMLCSTSRCFSITAERHKNAQ